MKISLKDIAELQPGVYLRANENARSAVYLLGIKDFDENLNLVEPSVIVDRSEVKDKYIIEESHILFSARLVFNAFKLPKSKDVYVASNSFILIKPDLEKIHSGYLRWLLNHPHTQKRLIQLTQGTSRMPYISQKKLGSLSIDLPELAVQKNIAALYDLLNKEKTIRQKLTLKREEYLQALLLKKTMNNEQ